MNNGVDIVGAWIPDEMDVYDVTIGEDHDLLGPYGPKTGGVNGNTGTPFSTVVGELKLSSFDSAGTYSVSTVPEPATLAALGIGALMLRRHRSRS